MIPIVATEIKGKESPVLETNILPSEHSKIRADRQRKLVVAGPHGNERNARFVVLETQRYFIRNPKILSNDLILYFIPAMSPTMFFADARGLPLDNKGEYLNKVPAAGLKNAVETKVTDTLKSLTIPRLHDDIAASIPGFTTWQDGIQGQGDPKKPKYGIDTNRDIYNVLPSTKSCLQFFIDNKENMAVFMLHGYEEIVRDRVLDGFIDGYQCTLAGPYKLEGNKGYIEEYIMNQMDVITSLIFGYRYKRENESKKAERSKNYFFKQDSNVGTIYNGEWSRKLFLNNNNTIGHGILCFDIEMAENYREGSRNQTGGKNTGNKMKYDPKLVMDRQNQNNMPFFNSSTERKFSITNKTVVFEKIGDEEDKRFITLSFNDFLLEYHTHKNKIVSKLN